VVLLNGKTVDVVWRHGGTRPRRRGSVLLGRAAWNLAHEDYSRMELLDVKVVAGRMLSLGRWGPA
jgi:hypothetical protein